MSKHLGHTEKSKVWFQKNIPLLNYLFEFAFKKANSNKSTEKLCPKMHWQVHGLQPKVVDYADLLYIGLVRLRRSTNAESAENKNHYVK